jgi:hypothetical protein
VYALGDGPVGDVVTAILQVDSRLRVIVRKIEAWSAGRDRDEPGIPDVPVAGTVQEARDLLDGYCTVVYVIVRWACAPDGAAGEAADRSRDGAGLAGQPPAEALAGIVAMLFSRLTALKRAVVPSAIPTMIALVTAAAMGTSPQRWRDQYGHVWSEGDVAALEATAVCLAEWVNRRQRSPDAALRLVMAAYERSAAHGGG